MNRLRVVLAGCGRMGLVHSDRVLQDGRAEIVACFDPQREAAEQLRQTHASSAVVCSGFEELLAQPDIDAIIIATPTICHREQVIAAAEQGWHVLCEKPLAGNRADILALSELAQSRPQQHFMLGYQRRCWAIYRRLCDELQSGRWGRVKAVTQVNAEHWQQTIANTWRDDPDINYGGFLGDAGSHKLDIIFFTTGLQPVSVFALSDRCGSHVEIVTSISARLTNDVPLTASFLGHSHSFQESLTVVCEHADLIVQDWKLWLGQNNELTLLEDGPDGFRRESPHTPVNAFLDLLTGQSPNTTPFSCALPVYDFTTAILTSAREGRAVMLSEQC